MNEPSVFTGPEITMPKDLVHYKGWEHRDVHNIYGTLLHQATYEGHLKREHNARPFILSRAFFVGTQRFGAIWTGDNMAQWDHLQGSIPMLLSVGAGGVAFAGADVGGFFHNPEADLLTRWFQAGAFQPFFRGHAHLDTRRREPWVMGEPYTAIIRDAIRKRYALLPYLYTLFWEASVNGMPVMRSMGMEHPSDSEVFDMDDQFYLGSAIVVKPVAEKDQASTIVHLPSSDVRLFENFFGLTN
jgi:alpha 1,3-glucosidase